MGVVVILSVFVWSWFPVSGLKRYCQRFFSISYKDHFPPLHLHQPPERRVFPGKYEVRHETFSFPSFVPLSHFRPTAAFTNPGSL